MSSEDAWNYHSSGAAALIKLRGPERCQSDFEKALLLSHVGQIVWKIALTSPQRSI